MRKRPTRAGFEPRRFGEPTQYRPDRLLQRPPDRRFTALVLARQLCHRLASSIALGDTPALAGVERIWSTELCALVLCSLDGLPHIVPGSVRAQTRLCRP